MKKILSILIAIILCVGLFPISVSAESVTASGKCGDAVNWYYYKDSESLTISGSGKMYDYSTSNRPPWYQYVNGISEIEITGITRIGAHAFSDMKYICEVKLSSTVTSIGKYAFMNLKNLKSISLPSKLTTIHQGAFSGCIVLESINIPEGVTSIPDYTFDDCSSLKSITLPNSLKTIEIGAFRRCHKLHTITLPEELSEIKEFAFSDCFALQSINIPKTVTKIGKNVFYNCVSFGDIYYEGAKEDWNKISIDSDNTELKAATVHYALPVYNAEPTASVAEGNYDSAQTVALNCSTADATIYYTTDNTIPTSKSTKYTGSIKITESTTLKAIAVKSGNADSSVMTYHYIIKPPESSVTVSTNQNMSVIHSVNPDYTVTIPIETQIGKSAVVSASGVKLNKGKTLSVKISATSGNNNAYTLKSAEGAVITYSVKKNGNDVVVGTPFLSVSADDSSGSATLDFALVGEEKYAGDYTGTVTFTVSVENNNGMYNKDFPDL